MHGSTASQQAPMLKAPLAQLSQRENEVLVLIAAGKTDKEIAGEIHLSLNTVRTYCKRIYQKLEVKNRTEAAAHFNQTQKNIS